ncbi:hypothetical protein J6590_058070 [Homalodisca vitripennis]|nr:hypothetical protein J6590_058070 [Homalodisca vitripennis]
MHAGFLSQAIGADQRRVGVDTLRKKVDSAKTDGDLNINLMNSLENADKKLNAMENENAHLKGMVGQLEGLQVNQAQKLEEKSHELLQMTQQLETLREESARQVARVKERSEMIRKCLQAQIGEMEREVATCRAATAFANRERDEIRSKLQMEVCLLSENFRDSQNRIVQLQQHVNYLSASHPTALIDLIK